MPRFETVGLAAFLARCCGPEGEEKRMSPLETGPSFPGQPAPAEGAVAAPCLAGERECAAGLSAPDGRRSSATPRPHPSLLTVLLRALGAWPT